MDVTTPYRSSDPNELGKVRVGDKWAFVMLTPPGAMTHDYNDYELVDGMYASFILVDRDHFMELMDQAENELFAFSDPAGYATETVLSNASTVFKEYLLDME